MAPAPGRPLVAVASVLAAALLGGCSVEGGETKTVTVQQPAGGGAGKSAPSAPAETPTPAEAPAEASLAQGEGTVDAVPIRFTITELRRRGPTVIVNARVEALRPEGEVAGQISQSFSDGQNQEGDDASSFDGVALIDPKARKKYLVARDSEGRCLCSNSLGGQFVDQAPANLEATLTAPPADVDRVDVLIPNIKTFADVPISG